MNMLIVKKFGGTSVADKDRIFNVAKRCIRDYEAGNDVVVVLSAMGKYTDELIAKAKDINPNPPKREMDMLFTIGEQMSVSLMAMAMAQLGVRAVSLNAFQVPMRTTSAYGNARLKKIDTERIRRELDDRKIVIVTGFQGVNKYDDYTLSIYDEIETNQIFGTKEISDILHFSSSGARRVLNKIIDTGVVTSVKGKGKGRYRFLNNEEIK